MKLILSTPGCPTSAAPVDGAADHDVEHPRGQPGFEGEFGEPQHPEGSDLRRLGHDGIAGRQRGAALLAHAHHRTVPRRNRGDDPVGLEADTVAPTAAGDHLVVELVAPTGVVTDPRRRISARVHDADRRPVVEGRQLGCFGRRGLREARPVASEHGGTCCAVIEKPSRPARPGPPAPHRRRRPLQPRPTCACTCPVAGLRWS